MMFGAMDTAGSGLVAYRQWMDAVSDNLANASDTVSTSEDAYQAREVQVTARAGDAGVDVTGVQFGSKEGLIVQDPTSSLADANGNVKKPDIDMGDQMTQLIAAQRGYQANLQTVSRAKDMYTAAIEIGK